MSPASSRESTDVWEKSRSHLCEDQPTLIDDFQPEPGEFVLVHDLGARLPCLVDGFNQVSDLNPYGVARNMMIKVHMEEVAGHRRAPERKETECSADAGKRRSRAGFGGKEWQSGQEVPDRQKWYCTD